MGSARWSPSDWSDHVAKTASKTQQQIFTQHDIHEELNPAVIARRESVDSDANPESTPIIIATDVTASMGILAETIVKKGLGVIMEEIYDRKPVPDPHLAIMAIGDAYVDRSPLQVTQFEADIVLAEQVKNIFIEHGGGGNGGESYNLAWWFALNRVEADAISKRGRKGFLFTIGDEAPHAELTASAIRQFCGEEHAETTTSRALLESLERNWEVFHLIVDPVMSQPVRESWGDLLQERAIFVEDHEDLAEVIVSTMQVIQGASVDDVAKSWSGSTELVVRNAVGGLTHRESPDADSGVASL